MKDWLPILLLLGVWGCFFQLQYANKLLGIILRYVRANMRPPDDDDD